jgi:glucosamine kinase
VRVLGLDIGGSTTRAVLDGDGVTVAEAEGPSASLTAAGPGAATRVLGEVLATLAQRSGGLGTLDAVCVGTAGSGAPDALDWVADRLRLVIGAHMGPGLHARDVPVRVTNDARLVLAAQGAGTGIALVAGTGSIALGLLGTREVVAGGWGHLLGDEGSGYWVVREAVRELCRRHERGAAPGALARAFGAVPTPELVSRFHEETAPAAWAASAPAVLESGDPAATAIAASGARHLAGLASAVAGQLGHPAPVPVVLAGGLAGRPGRYADAVRDAVEGEVAGARVEVASRRPVDGAVRLARALAAGAPG